jgi:hypothetical protein
MPSDRNSVTVLTLDPGERVGWSMSRFSWGPLSAPGQWVWDVLDYGILPLKKAALKLHGRAADPWADYDVLLYENYILTTKGARVSVGSEQPTVQFVGMIRLHAWLHPGAYKLIDQPPKGMSTGRLVLNDDRPDYSAVRDIIHAAPSAHDDSHHVSALLHTAAHFHRRYA